MADTVGSIKYDLDLDDSEFKSKSADASNRFDSLTGKVKAAEGASFAFAAALAAVGSSIIAFGISSLNAYQESETAIAQTNAVLKSTGGIAGVTAQQVDQLATSLQNVTRYSDESIRSGENILLTFTNIGKDIFPQTTQTILDMSTALGQDLQSSAIQLGKALQDPVLGVSALRRVGVNFSDAQKDVIAKLVETGKSAEAQKLILKELQTEFGGSAQAAGKTFAGSMDIAKNKVNDFQEIVGKSIADALQPMIANFNQLFDAMGGPQGLFDKLVVTFQTIQPYLLPISGAIIGALVPAMVALGIALWGVASAAIASVIALLPFIAVGLAIGLLAKLIIDHWSEITAFFTLLWQNVQLIFTTAWAAIVEFFTVGIPTFITSVITFFQALPQMIVDFVWNVIILGYVNFWGFLIGLAIYWVPFIISTIITFFQELPGKILKILTNVWEFFVKVWTDIWNWLTKTVPLIISDVMEFIKQLPTKVSEAMIATKNSFVKGMQDTWNAIVSEISQWPAKMKDWGTNLMNSFADGIRAAIGKIAEAFKEGMNKAKGMVEGHSPPLEGPFKDIDKWGFNIGMGWVDGFYEAFSTLSLPNLADTSGGGGLALAGAAGGNSSNQNITINIDKVGGTQDVRAIGRELGFRAGIMPA